jgi:hypothetical protein
MSLRPNDKVVTQERLARLIDARGNIHDACAATRGGAYHGLAVALESWLAAARAADAGHDLVAVRRAVQSICAIYGELSTTSSRKDFWPWTY